MHESDELVVVSAGEAGQGVPHHHDRQVLLDKYIQGGPKKSGISKTMAITPLKSIRKGKSWCVSENSA